MNKISDDEKEIITGIHSIAHALRNKNRVIFELVGTQKGYDELFKKGGFNSKDLDSINSRVLDGHKLQEYSKKCFKDLEYNYQRIKSQLILITSIIDVLDPLMLFNAVQETDVPLKIICLDQITDINNAAAIVRTAAFYGVDYLVVPSKNTFSLNPSFIRIASGGIEYVKVVRVNSITKIISKLKGLDVLCIGFSEHSTEALTCHDKTKSTCLVFGSEDSGISHSVSRVLDNMVALLPRGEIQSLNVSVASALGMAKFFDA